MSISSKIGILVYCGGRIVQNAHHVTYDRPAIGARRIPRMTNFTELLDLLYKMTKIDEKKYLLKVSARCCDKNTEEVVVINNDQDLKFFFDLDAGFQSVLLFVEAEQLQSDVFDLPRDNDYYQYASILRGERPGELPTVPQGVLNVGIHGKNQNVGPGAYDRRIGKAPLHATDSIPRNAPLRSESCGSRIGQTSESQGYGGVDVNDRQDGNPSHEQAPFRFGQRTDYGKSSKSPFFNSVQARIPSLNASYRKTTADSTSIPKYTSGFYDSNKGELKMFMVFKDKKDVVEAVKDYSENHARRGYRVADSSITTWKAVCKHTPKKRLSSSSPWCCWQLRAKFDKKINLWKVTKYGYPHTCLMNAESTDHRCNLCRKA